jgi:pantoate--beta-alanine ligase
MSAVRAAGKALPPVILREKAALRAAVAGWQRAGEVVGVVPTMGALHEGHLSLVEAAQAQCDRVVVTIFVNPAQFNNPADLDSYPRTETQDAEKLARFAVDAIYAPAVDQIYPQGFATKVSVAGLTDVLCGAHRPGHFDGVATVVTKLFTQTRADKAFFGEKDFQQLQVVRRLARDLDLDVAVVGCPTIREEDGTAMSSRNLLLSDRARIKAPALHEALQEMAAGLRAGGRAADLAAAARARLLAAGFTEVEYIDLRACDDLAALETPERPARLLAAAWLAGVRLIDNIAV